MSTNTLIRKMNYEMVYEATLRYQENQRQNRSGLAPEPGIPQTVHYLLRRTKKEMIVLPMLAGRGRNEQELCRGVKRLLSQQDRSKPTSGERINKRVKRLSRIAKEGQI